MIILLKLFLGHLIGDFFLQPDTWVKAKEKKKLMAWQLYIHALLHGIIVFLLVWDLNFWFYALAIAIIHLLIDAGKLWIQEKANKRVFFFIDQGLHLMSIYFIWIWYQHLSFPFEVLNNERIVLLVTFILMLTQPVSIVIKIFISKWSPQTDDDETESLQSAGKYIGILERLFAFVFVIAGRWEAIGFLIAAKSVFRFGDLKDAKDRKLTEYILIGTLISFGIAIFTGIMYKYLITLIV